MLGLGQMLASVVILALTKSFRWVPGIYIMVLWIYIIVPRIYIMVPGIHIMVPGIYTMIPLGYYLKLSGVVVTSHS